MDSHTAERERRADILRLRRRFLKDREKESVKFAKKEIQSQRTERVRNSDIQKCAGICIMVMYFNNLFCRRGEQI